MEKSQIMTGDLIGELSSQGLAWSHGDQSDMEVRMTQESLISVDLDASQQPINGYPYSIIPAEWQDSEEKVEFSAEASRTSNNDLEVFRKPRFERLENLIKELEQ